MLQETAVESLTGALTAALLRNSLTFVGQRTPLLGNSSSMGIFGSFPTDRVSHSNFLRMNYSGSLGQK